MSAPIEPVSPLPTIATGYGVQPAAVLPNDPFSTELTISRTYGFAPAAAAAIALPALHPLVNANPAGVTRVPAVSPIVRTEESPEHTIDRYA